MPNKKPIYVTQPSLAPLEEFNEILKGVWQRGILTHNGPLVQKLEADLVSKLGLSHLSLVSNGTIAIQMAIKALELKGEIITSPFTWVATLSAIQWEGCTPVFSDIDPDTLNMDPALIEAQITDKTVAIMPVHVFGNPCDVDAIQAIADKHGLKVIYDAAHAIGSEYNGRSLLSYGDISATSLHATKLFNTAEGGACITNDAELDQRLRRIRFFGHNEQKDIVMEGFNGKLTEVHAALGLANMKYYEEVLQARKELYDYYKDGLSQIEELSFQKIYGGVPNYSYFPVVFGSEQRLLETENSLSKKGYFPRRYFYPSVNTLTNIVDYVAMPKSEDLAKRILCLPLYFRLSKSDVDEIIVTILDSYK
jgi:dTDP-4-amino-4,6-dideoxygalactose transaminase